MPLRRRRRGARRPPGRPGAQLGLSGWDHAAARRRHHGGGLHARLAGRRRQRPGQAAGPAGRAEPQPGRPAAEPAEAEAPPDALHAGAAQRAGEELRQDPLPGHLHARGAGPAHRPHRVPGAGLVPEPASQVEEAQEDHQRVPRPGHAAAHAGPAPVPFRRRGRRGRHGRQPVLLPRQRHALGRGRHAGGLAAAPAAGAGQAAGHGAVAVAVQPGGRAAAQHDGPVQQPGGHQRRRPAVAPLPARLPRHGARLPVRPQQRDGLAAALQLPGQQRRVAGNQHRLPPPKGARAHSLHELHLMASPSRPRRPLSRPFLHLSRAARRPPFSFLKGGGNPATTTPHPPPHHYRHSPGSRLRI